MRQCHDVIFIIMLIMSKICIAVAKWERGPYQAQLAPNLYRLGTVNSKSFVSKVLLRIKWKFELTVHFKHEMLGK